MLRRAARPRGPRAVIIAVVALLVASSAFWIPALAEGDPIVGTATVVNTDGEGVNLREHPWVEADVVFAIPEGSVVDVLTTDLFDDGGMEWWKIRIDGDVGYSVARYLALRGGAPPPAPLPDGAGSVGRVAGQQARVAATDGQGLNLRERPWVEAAATFSMPEGTVVQVLQTGLFDDTGMEWWMVSVGGVEGYSAAQYLAVTGNVAAPGVVPAPPPSASGLVIGQPVRVSGTGGEGVNVRDGAGVGSTAVDRLPEEAVVTIADGPATDENGVAWYRVTAAGVDGWVHGGYLAAIPLVGPVTVSSSSDGNGTGSSDWLDAGDAIVAEAMTYLGAPYLWAGTTPAGFDCSGFTYYVVNRVMVNEFPRAIEQQIDEGVAVDVANLRPGDLVFFENTYKAGLSHVGIYVGEGQFISAGGEDVVVGLDSLNDAYWATRYVGARRVGG